MHDINIWPLLLIVIIIGGIPTALAYWLLGKFTDYVVFKVLISASVFILATYLAFLFVTELFLSNASKLPINA